MIPSYRNAIVKWNGGRGALLCSRCHTIIREGFLHTDAEHFCDDCSVMGGSGASVREIDHKDPDEVCE